MEYRVCRIDDTEFILPITQGARYRSAYHGTQASAVADIITGAWQHGDEGWYGPGIYFWLERLRPAIWWARDKRGYAEWVVYKCEVDSGDTLNAEALIEDERVMEAVNAYLREHPTEAILKGVTSRHEKSVAVIVILNVCKQRGIVVHTVKSLMPWGPPPHKWAEALYVSPEYPVKRTIKHCEVVHPTDISSQMKEARSRW